MAKEPLFPTVTDAQVELWLASPVTKAFIQCLEWKKKDTQDNAGNGNLVDSSSADLTHALLHRALGQQDAFSEAMAPEALLEYYELVFHPLKEEDESDE